MSEAIALYVKAQLADGRLYPFTEQYRYRYLFSYEELDVYHYPEVPGLYFALDGKYYTWSDDTNAAPLFHKAFALARECP